MPETNRDFGRTFFKIILIFLFILALTFLFSAFLLNQDFFLRFSIDKHFEASTIQQIHTLKMMMLVFSTLFLIVTLLLIIFRKNSVFFINKHKKGIQGVLLLLSIILVFCFMGEIICRILFYDKTSNFGIGPGTLKFNEEYIHLNSEGMRDIEFNLTKNPDTTRIVVIGDSYTYGFGVKNASNTYSKVLESELKKIGNYEVLNFGKPGTYLKDELDIYKEKAAKYSPDIVIIGYVLRDLNNVDNNLSFGKKNSWYSLPYIGFWLRSTSYFYFYLESQLNKLIIKFDPSKDYEHSILEAYNSSLNQEYNREIFNNFSKELKGKKVIVVIFPLIYTSDNYLFFDAQKFITNVSRENNFTVVDLHDSYKPYKGSELVVNNEDSHINELGHKIAAEEIYKAIINNTS